MLLASITFRLASPYIDSHDSRSTSTRKHRWNADAGGMGIAKRGFHQSLRQLGVAVREFSLKTGHGEADYLLFVHQKAVGVVEAKPEGFTLTGVETQSTKYSEGLPDYLQAFRRPLPFLYESTVRKLSLQTCWTRNREAGWSSPSISPRRWPGGLVCQTVTRAYWILASRR